MMKSFFKKLSVAMALALVLGTTAQAGVAKAADTWKFKKNSKILYLNENNTTGTKDTYDFDFAKGTLPENWKELYNFSWISDNEKVVVAGKSGVVTAVSVGKANIQCIVTDKVTGKVVATATAPVTVKENAADVVITNADEYDVVVPGTVVDLNRAMWNSNGDKTTKRGEYVTDYTRWVATDAEGNIVDAETVTINQKSGKFTMNKPGVYSLYAETYQSKANPGTTASSQVVTIVVEEPTVEMEAVQTGIRDFTLRLPEEYITLIAETYTADETRDIFLKNLSIALVDEDGKDEVVYQTDSYVRDVKLDTVDKTLLHVTVWDIFENDRTYTVRFDKEYKDELVEDYIECSMVTSVDKPEVITLSSKEVQNTPEQAIHTVYTDGETVPDGNQIYVKYWDKKGIDVTEIYEDHIDGWTEFEYGDEAVEFTFDEAARKLYAYESGKKFTVKVTYNEYDEVGNIVTKGGKPVTFTAVKAPAAQIKEVVKVGIVYSTDNVPDYAEVKNDAVDYKSYNGTNSTRKLAANDGEVYFGIAAIDEYDNLVGNAGITNVGSGFTFYSSNDRVASIDETTGLLTPNAKGNVTITVYYTDPFDYSAKPKKVDSYPLTIREARYATQLYVDGKVYDTITSNVVLVPDADAENYKGKGILASKDGEEVTLTNAVVELTNVDDSASFIIRVKDNLGEDYTRFVNLDDITLEADVEFTKSRHSNGQWIVVSLANSAVETEMAELEAVKKETFRCDITLDRDARNEDRVVEGNAFTKNVRVTLEKPSVDIITGYELDIPDVDLAYDLSEFGTKITLYGLNKEGLRVWNFSKDYSLKYSPSEKAADYTEAGIKDGDFFYTIVKNNKLVDATTEGVIATSGSIFVAEDYQHYIELIQTKQVENVTSVTADGYLTPATEDVTVTHKADKGLYSIIVYKADGGKAKFVKRDTFTVSDNLGAVTFTQNSDKTSHKVFGVGNKLIKTSKLSSAVAESVAVAIQDAFTFKFNGATYYEAEYVDEWPMDYEVRLNDDMLYIKNVTLYRPIYRWYDGQWNFMNEYEEVTVFVGKTIRVGVK